MNSGGMGRALAAARTRTGAAVIVLLLACLAAAIIFWPSAPKANTDEAAKADRILARARIEPADRVHLVSGPSGGGTIARLDVREGTEVQAGQILATLDTFPEAEAALELAKRDLVLARLELRQVAAGAERGELSAQRALIASRRAELTRAESQLARAQALTERRFLSSDALEQRELQVKQSRQAVSEAEASLRALVETRPVDVDVASARIAQAEARLKAAQAQRDRTVIQAPIGGTVLAVFARAGGTLGQEGLLTIGNLDRLIAIGEFDEQVAALVRSGQPAEVTIRGDSRIFKGRVTRIFSSVNRNERPTTDVLNGRDARIVEAEIGFDPGQRVPPLVGVEAVVAVRPAASRPS